jgi:transposase-like protein
MTGRCKLPVEQQQIIIEMYKNGTGLREIGRQLNTNKEIIKRVVKNAGIFDSTRPRRIKGSSKGTYTYEIIDGKRVYTFKDKRKV